MTVRIILNSRSEDNRLAIEGKMDSLVKEALQNVDSLKQLTRCFRAVRRHA